MVNNIRIVALVFFWFTTNTAFTMEEKEIPELTRQIQQLSQDDLTKLEKCVDYIQDPPIYSPITGEMLYGCMVTSNVTIHRSLVNKILDKYDIPRKQHSNVPGKLKKAIQQVKKKNVKENWHYSSDNS